MRRDGDTSTVERVTLLAYTPSAAPSPPNLANDGYQEPDADVLIVYKSNGLGVFDRIALWLDQLWSVSGALKDTDRNVTFLTVQHIGDV